MDENNDTFFQEDDANLRPKRSIHAPSKETMKKMGIVGGCIFKGALGALAVARVATYLASSGIYAISKTGALEVLAASLLTIGATVAIMPLAATLGIGNKAMGKNFNFSNNVVGGVRTAKLLMDPLVKGIGALVNLSSAAISMATKESLKERISKAAGDQFPLETIGETIENLFQKPNNQKSNVQNQQEGFSPDIDDWVPAV